MKKMILYLLVVLSVIGVASAITTNSATITPTSAYADSVLTFYCNVSGAEGNLSILDTAWQYNTTNWTVLYTGTYLNATSGANTAVYLKSSGLVKGYEYISECMGKNSTKNGTQMNSTIKLIRNSIPVVSSLTITNPIYGDTTPLTCSYTATDADNDTITKYYRWYVNSAYVTNTSTLTNSYGVSSTFRCEAWAGDGTDNSTHTNSTQYTSSNRGVSLTCDGKSEICNVMEGSGAGLGKFIEYMGLSIPTLLIVLILVGIIAAVGYSIATVIKNAITRDME